MDNLEVSVSQRNHIETLRKMLFGRQSFYRLSSEEREAINFAISKLEQELETDNDK